MPRVPVALGAALGVLLEARFGEVPIEPHPVAAFGSAMQAFERRGYDGTRAGGVVHAAVGLGIGLGAGAFLGRGVGATTAATFLAVAGRGLGDAAALVGDALSAGDLEGARIAVQSLVGRDPWALDEADIVRAVVESVAENTVDAVVAPACWAALAGAPGALGYRAVNTLDAMVGHRSSRYAEYGWASARLDDAANWVPARLTAALVIGVRPAAAASVLRAVRDDAPDHPSPNSGVAEAAFAAALGLRLGGESRYGSRVEIRPTLGDGRPPERADIARAVTLSADVGLAMAGLLTAAGTALGLRRWSRWSR
ncbi:MAG: adenosylcobinamide-phosphate synthase CbiB [Acidimicrobiales bacterium]